MNSIKYVYWFAYFDLRSPSVRYRGLYPLGFLKEKYGVRSSFFYPSYKLARVLRFIYVYLSVLLFRKRNSLIIIQRINSNFIYANALKLLVRLRNANTIYDLDDADFLIYPPKTIEFFSAHCQHVSVGSTELEQSMKRFNKNTILNTSPTPDLDILKSKRNEFLTIGWIGDFSGDHKSGLVSLVFPALKELPFKIRLVLIGVTNKSEHAFLSGYFQNVDGLRLVVPTHIDWTDERSIQEMICEFDIGIATLLDNEMHRSKSAFKVKQYLNNGVPVLSSDIPENNRFVKHGTNGFLCTGPDEFRKRIVEINSLSDEAYRRLSESARASIEDFNLKKYCETLSAAGGFRLPT